MSQTLSLSDPSAGELWTHAQANGPVTLSADLRREITAGLEAPTVPPEVTLPPGALPPIPGSIPPFDKVLPVNWVWGDVPPQVDTYTNPMGPHGILVCAFVPQATDMSGLVSLGVYPGTMAACARAVSISKIAGDFTQPFPYTIYADNASYYFQVGGTSRTMAVLQAGTPYYINVANVDESGAWTSSSTRHEFRFHIAPPYHY